MASCTVCKTKLPFEWDHHTLCPCCRGCTPNNLCSVCLDWPTDSWDKIPKWLQQKVKERRRRESATAAKPKSTTSGKPSAKASTSSTTTTKKRATGKTKTILSESSTRPSEGSVEATQRPTLSGSVATAQREALQALPFY